MVSKFPTTIKIDVKMSALHQAITSAMESTDIDELDAFSRLVFCCQSVVHFCFLFFVFCFLTQVFKVYMTDFFICWIDS